MKAFAILTAAAAFSGLQPCTASAPPVKNTLEVTYMPTPVFPQDQIQRGIIDGEVSVIVSIDPNGRAADWLVTASTDPAFEKMAAELLPDIEFKLPAVGDRTSPVRVGFNLSFEARGVVVSHAVTDTIDNLINRMVSPRRINKLGTPRQLDRVLTLRHTVAPLYPETPHTSADTRVVLDFLVDETGRVRMPVLHAGNNELLARASAHALLDWRFDPPTRDGRPVIVAARQEFVLPPR
jgi:outer membrane biosynthesis protein TonB